MSERGQRLDAYHFYERDYETYDALYEDFEWEVPDRFNIATYVCDRWADGSERTALYGEDGNGERVTYTFDEVRDQADDLATALSSAGVGRGDAVGVNLPQRPETVIAHVACWKLGAISVPLSTLFGPDAIEYRLGDCDAVAAVVDASNMDAFREARESLSALEHTLVVDGAELEDGERDYNEALESTDGDVETARTDAEDDAVLIYTSGTTGNPKGVRHAHRFLLGHLPLFVTAFTNMDVREGDVCYTPAEWAWVASLFDVVFAGLYYGLPILAYDGGEFDPETAFDLLDRYDVTNFFAPPTALRMMMQVDDPDRFEVDALRTIASGGESLGQTIVDWAGNVFDGAAVHEGYGQTEANMLAGDCTALTPFKEGLIGPPGPGHELAIVDPETAEPTVDTSDVGEIAVRYAGNPVCFKEYWGKPEATDAKVRNGWLLTEDLGWMDEDDYVGFESRTDDVIISAGYRIGPEEVEDTIAGHAAVADVGVIGVPHEERGEVPKAFVVPTADATRDDDLRADIRRHVRERLAAYEYPREVEFLDALPTTATGKVRRASLRNREGLDT